MGIKKTIHIFQSLLYSVIYIALIYIVINIFLGKYINDFWSYVKLISVNPESSFSSKLQMGEDGLKSRPEYGKQYGDVKIETLNINLPLYYGDTLNELKNGIGQSARSFCPGEGKTIIITGHNTEAKLKKIANIKMGEEIVINTTYGTYKYKVSNTERASNKNNIYRAQKDKENLIMYIENSNELFIVHADLDN